jgi:type I restriction enzyme S subunit
MMSNKNVLVNLANVTTIPGITRASLVDIQIPLPSLEKQQEIVEQIDFYTQMAHTEEQSLKILEKIVMGWVKEMGRGKERVKLGEVCSVKTGKYITKATSSPGIYPTYGGGDAGAYISEYNRENEFMISKDGVSEKCVRYVCGKFFLNHHGWTIEPKGVVTYPYVGYWLLSNQDKLYELAVGTAQKGINQDSFYSIEIPLPSLAEQQTLQSDFDEIRHKYAKIAEYKAKAQEAIQRLIPGAKKETEKVITNQIIVPITMSHTSTCEVKQDGSGCTCRLPLPIEKEEEHTFASTVSTSVTPATATVKRRKPKIAPKISVE